MSDSQTIVLERWSEDPEFRNWPRTDSRCGCGPAGSPSVTAIRKL